MKRAALAKHDARPRAAVKGKEAQRGAIVAALQRHGRLTRPELASVSGVAYQSVYWRVGQLLEDGILEEAGLKHDVATGHEDNRAFRIATIPLAQSTILRWTS